MASKWSSLKRGSKEHKEARFIPPSPTVSKRGKGYPANQPFQKPGKK